MPDNQPERIFISPTYAWRRLRAQHFSFLMLCGYLIVEYLRPQSLYPGLAVLPWAAVFTVLAAVGALRDPTVKWVPNAANRWMIAFFVIILASSAQAEYTRVSFENLYRYYYWGITYFLAIAIVNTRERLYIFIAFILLASFKISLSLSLKWAARGFSFTRYGLVGPAGYFENSGELAIQMVIVAAISYSLLQSLRVQIPRNLQWAFALVPLTAAVTVLGSSSRGGQLALVAAILFYFGRRIVNLKVMIPVALAAVALYNLLPEEQIQRFRGMGQDKTSIQRLAYWEKGIEMLNQNPLLGVGYYNFAPYFGAHYSEFLYFRKGAQLPHNIFVQVGSELGYTGLLVYFLLIRHGFRNVRAGSMLARARGDAVYANLGKGLNSAFIGFLVAGQFVSVVYYPFMWIHLAVTAAFANIAMREQARPPDRVLLPEARQD